MRGDGPNVPNYAWPSYAASPNYAALQYPTQYSPTAWPYIGPFYPYPQVPLGWRRVSLEWDDGWWYLDFDERLAMLCCVIPTVWCGMGPGCLIYLAALKAVPEDLYEAADIDGYGFFGKVAHITLPTLKGLIIIQFIGAFIIASQSTGFILVMTFGGPNEVTKVAGLHIFEKAYLLLRFGTAVTMAWLLGAVMLCFTTLQLKRLSRMEFTTADQSKAPKP